MKIINEDELDSDFIIEEIKKGKLFIYPTDTLYGIGCDATNNDAVQKIYHIKKRDDKPFLKMIPNKKWLEDNAHYNQKLLDQFRLPGPYSFIVEINKSPVGVRLPDCSFSSIVEQANIPFISTSLNISGEPPALTIEEVDDEIKKQVDYIITTNKQLLGKPSSLYDIRGEELQQLR